MHLHESFRSMSQSDHEMGALQAYRKFKTGQFSRMPQYFDPSYGTESMPPLLNYLSYIDPFYCFET